MQLLAVLSLVSAVAATCAGNNCNRAVTGTRPGLLPLTSRSSDCASYLRTTVTPKATTITVTVTVDGEHAGATYRPHRQRGLEGRQVTVTPTHIPDYAANCANAAEYISACSCFGLTGTVTTAPTPRVTVTTTVVKDDDGCEDI